MTNHPPSNSEDKTHTLLQQSQEFKLLGDSFTCFAISPDASLCATGSQDGCISLLEICENGGGATVLTTINTTEAIISLTFASDRYWIIAGTEKTIKVYDLESKNVIFSEDNPKETRCISVTWVNNSLIVVYSNGLSRIYHPKSNTDI